MISWEEFCEAMYKRGLAETNNAGWISLEVKQIFIKKLEEIIDRQDFSREEYIQMELNKGNIQKYL